MVHEALVDESLLRPTIQEIWNYIKNLLWEP